jgi:putative ABC transport system permease protein
VPFRNGSSNTSVSLKQEQERPTAFVTMYMFGEGAVHAWAAADRRPRLPARRVQQRRGCQKNASTNTASSVIISRTLADKLYPGENALGKTYYMGKQPLHVVGIVASLATPTDYNNTTLDAAACADRFRPRARTCCAPLRNARGSAQGRDRRAGTQRPQPADARQADL